MEHTPDTSNDFQFIERLSTLDGELEESSPSAEYLGVHRLYPGWAFSITLGSDASVTSFAMQEIRSIPETHAADFDIMADEIPFDFRAQNAPLTRRLLKDLPFGTMVEAVRDDFRNVVATYIERGEEEAIDWHEALKRPGRGGRSDYLYATIAIDYASRAGVGAVEAMGAERGLTKSQMQTKLQEARRRKLLTKPPKQGLPGGVATERAFRVVEQYRSRIDDDENEVG